MNALNKSLQFWMTVATLLSMVCNTAVRAFDGPAAGSRAEIDLTKILDDGAIAIQQLLDAKIYDVPHSEALFFKHLNRAFDEAKQSIQSMSGAEVESQLKAAGISMDNHVLTSAEILNALSDTSDLRLSIAKELAATKAQHPGENAVPIFLKKAQEKVLNRGFSLAVDWWRACIVILYPTAIIIAHQLLPAASLLGLAVGVGFAMFVPIIVCFILWTKFHKEDTHVDSVAALAESDEPKVELAGLGTSEKFFSLHGADDTSERKHFENAIYSLSRSLDQIYNQCKGYSPAERVRKKEILLERFADLDNQALALESAAQKRSWRDSFHFLYTSYQSKANWLKFIITDGNFGVKLFP